MKRIFTTNLDLDGRHISAMAEFKLEETPQIGSKIKLQTKYGLALFLEVYSITYCENATDVFNNTHCVILLTPWEEYRKLRDKDVKKMSIPFVIDTRRILKLRSKKINYVGHGIGQ